MKQETRVIWAVILSAAIYYVYLTYFAPKPPLLEPAPQTITQSAPATLATPVAPGADQVDPSFTADVKTLSVTTDKVNFILSTKGAVLTSAALADYKESTSKDSPQKDLLTETPGSSALFLGLDGVAGLTPDSVFQVVSDTPDDHGKRTIVLAWQNQQVRLEKTFVFGDTKKADSTQKADYGLDVSYKLINRSSAPLIITPFFQTSLGQKPQPTGWSSHLSRTGGDLFFSAYAIDGKPNAQIPWAKLVSDVSPAAPTWSGLTDRYFLFATAFDAPVGSAKIEKQAESIVARSYASVLTLNAGADASGHAFAYLGPKKQADLANFPISLKGAVDYGWFKILSVPLLALLSALHSLIPSWGLSIILMTFIVKLLTYPINKKSMSSMKAMQQLQPKMQEIKKRYADDKQKQNEEVMQLFRTHKVNPMGGCLPMMLQMPVYIVLYKVLWNAVELYHAPFMWYRDLSAPDPYFIAPILLGVFMFLQQQLTPSPTADEQQKNMMKFMPLLFITFMLFLPVGLVIYIFINTAMSVMQQFLMQRDLRMRDVLRGKWHADSAAKPAR